jgi:hypothetical protein
MMLQENIDFTHYFRCYCLDRKHVRIMPYEPRNAFHERYIQTPVDVDQAMLDELHRIVLEINQWLGYDFNTVEIAVRDGKYYPIDFCNPAPDADNFSVGDDNFEWVLEHSAQMAIDKAKAHKPDQMNLTWGKFVEESVGMRGVSAQVSSAFSKIGDAVSKAAENVQEAVGDAVAKRTTTRKTAAAKPKVTAAKKAPVKKPAAKTTTAKAKAPAKRGAKSKSDDAAK